MSITSKILIIGITVNLLSNPLTAWQLENPAKVTLAVMDFKNNSPEFRFDRLQRAIPEMLKTELSHFTEVQVVERSKIESILTEQALAQAGVIENQQAQEIGKLAGAEYIITGEINTTAGRLRIDAHLIKVATGQVVGEKMTGNDERSLEPMVKLLAQNLIFNLTGKGERQPFAQIHRYYWDWGLATTAALAIATTVLHFKYQDSYDHYHDSNQLNQFDRHYHDANKYHKSRNIMLGITGAAAWTTFILWKKDKDESNKIYASHFREPIDPKLAMAVAIQKGDYLVALSFRF